MSDTPSQPRAGLVPLLRLALLPALLVYVLALWLSGAAGIEAELVLRDLAQTCKYPLGVGLLSNLGYLLWMAAAAIAFFGALSGVTGARGRHRQLLLLGGGFSLLLALDDMFLLHDRYIGANFLYALYAVFAVALLLRYRSLVPALGGLSFLAAVVLLGSSVLVDEIQSLLPFRYELTQLFEEGFKFLGIAAWLYFWWQAAAGASRLGANS
ncbi:oxidoreductase [Vulcanococcus limneticus Candia 3F8]|uniref:oxidoreductase n=1 Tax=Vulcanococcus limneticus TaxID=2170428 RepID=UPI000B989E88|nr:oxidoreductase [Vulcanococcus limneticus]MCP9792108.1 oxidoreductase [Vulcanococcus limneticus MW73D5]MCP9893915.1 oxidoreductase [Vulcanococcus limneticus Candia 3F8]MCP9897478.1 oxidoreductase [Vulcanococcus limneticus Candia 3B3]